MGMHAANHTPYINIQHEKQNKSQQDTTVNNIIYIYNDF